MKQIRRRCVTLDCVSCNAPGYFPISGPLSQLFTTHNRFGYNGGGNPPFFIIYVLLFGEGKENWFAIRSGTNEFVCTLIYLELVYVLECKYETHFNVPQWL